MKIAPSRASLARVGVDLIKSATTLRCQICGHEWRRALNERGRMEMGWWQCPNGCNEAMRHQGPAVVTAA